MQNAVKCRRRRTKETRSVYQQKALQSNWIRTYVMMKMMRKYFFTESTWAFRTLDALQQCPIGVLEQENLSCLFLIIFKFRDVNCEPIDVKQMNAAF